jgi:hypothetical protein
MDIAKYFQNGLAEIIEIRHTVRSVEIISFDIFLNFLRSFILKIQTEYIKKKKIKSLNGKYINFTLQKIFKMAAMWVCVTTLNSQKIFFLKILNLPFKKKSS